MFSFLHGEEVLAKFGSCPFRAKAYVLKLNSSKIKCNIYLKQQDLAKSVGVTRQTIGLIEAGDYNPTLNLCIGICKALGKTLDELFWEGQNE